MGFVKCPTDRQSNRSTMIGKHRDKHKNALMAAKTKKQRTTETPKNDPPVHTAHNDSEEEFPDVDLEYDITYDKKLLEKPANEWTEKALLDYLSAMIREGHSAPKMHIEQSACDGKKVSCTCRFECRGGVQTFDLPIAIILHFDEYRAELQRFKRQESKEGVEEMCREIVYGLVIGLPIAPPELRCPLTGKLFMDPVTTSAGFTYERSAIQAWVDDGNTYDPMMNIGGSRCEDTPAEITHQFVPCRHMRQAVLEWKRQHDHCI